MKKLPVIILGIALLLIMGIILTYYLQNTSIKKSEINMSDILSVSDAYKICNAVSCSNESIEIQGNLMASGSSGSFSLINENSTDYFNKVIWINLGESNMSMIDILRYREKTFLQKDGVVTVKLKGRLYYDAYGMCTDTCKGIVKMIIEPNQTEVIKKVGCKDPRLGRSSFEQGDCFDVSYRVMNLEQAYSILSNSTICTKEGRTPSGYSQYFSEGEIHNGLSEINSSRWAFQISSSSMPGGCSEYCYVLENKIVFSRLCAQGQDLMEEENISAIKV